MQLHELCDSIRATIQTDFDDTYRVTAEISSLTAKAGGHCFLELIEKRDDKNAPSKQRTSADIIAKVRATCWANVWSMLSAYFFDATGMQLQVGMQVEVDVNVDFHPVYGFSLVIVGINPEFTLGGLMRQRRETIARLEKEGMMELQPALTLPTLVRRIAVISAADAAGYQDFTDQLRQSGYAFLPQLFPATMQGDAAPSTIMAALDRIYASTSPFDLVVIIRGGGANTDLTCFDDYELCSFCAQFPVPILSGIGHTRDVSILDLVCFQAVKTPTAAAEWLIARYQAQADRINQLANLLQLQITRALSDEHHRLDLLAKTIELHSPEAIYRMGYSLTLHNGQPVHSVSQLTPGDQVDLVFLDGSTSAQVTK